jgi:glycosyltransferase involved in cell wall biosynthesis
VDVESDILAYHDGFSDHPDVTSTLLYSRRSGKKILATVAIPTYKREILLKQAIDSVAAQTTDGSVEILIVDNDPQTDGAQIIEHLENIQFDDVRYVRNSENVGMFGNWNRCLLLAESEWITILNDDDLLYPNFIAECFKQIALNPGMNLIGTGSTVLDERCESGLMNIRRMLRAVNIERWKQIKLKRMRTVDYFLNSPHHGSLGIMFRTKLSRELGGYTPALFPSADLVFLVRFQQHYGAFYLSKVLATYRIAVNESLKPTVVQGWVSQGLRLRASLMEFIPLPQSLLQLYSRLMAAEVILLCKDYFSIDFSIEALRVKYRLPVGAVFFRFRILRLVIRLISLPQRH